MADTYAQERVRSMITGFHLGRSGCLQQAGGGWGGGDEKTNKRLNLCGLNAFLDRRELTWQFRFDKNVHRK